jgi:hypothetical protein
MIKNGKDYPLSSNPGTLPDMQGAMLSWFQRLTFTKVVKTVVNHEVEEETTTFEFTGVRQPMSPQQLEMKPEGQRAWKWEMIHAFPDLILKPDEIIVFESVPYRVMKKSDFKEYGYILYEIVEDYRGLE